MGGFGFGEILMIVGIILLLFGAKKIPELMRGLGKGMREFKDARNTDINESGERVDRTDSPVSTTNNPDRT
jgi:sec-independent protein translocase protein TatA